MKKQKKYKIASLDLSRRNFFKKLWVGLSLVVCFEAVIVFFSFLWQGRKRHTKKETDNIFDVGSVEDFEINTVTPFRRGQFYLARLSDGGFLAMSIKCSHLSCSVRWEKEENRFICPCHSSMFDMKGNVLSPPAPRALDLYQVIIESGVVRVNTGKRTQRRRFNQSQVTYG
jgi:cytochrome b6-f complex iron-sulfur subunit